MLGKLGKSDTDPFLSFFPYAPSPALLLRSFPGNRLPETLCWSLEPDSFVKPGRSFLRGVDILLNRLCSVEGQVLR